MGCGGTGIATVSLAQSMRAHAAPRATAAVAVAAPERVVASDATVVADMKHSRGGGFASQSAAAKRAAIGMKGARVACRGWQHVDLAAEDLHARVMPQWAREALPDDVVIIGVTHKESNVVVSEVGRQLLQSRVVRGDYVTMHNPKRQPQSRVVRGDYVTMHKTQNATIHYRGHKGHTAWPHVASAEVGVNSIRFVGVVVVIAARPGCCIRIFASGRIQMRWGRKYRHDALHSTPAWYHFESGEAPPPPRNRRPSACRLLRARRRISGDALRALVVKIGCL